MARSGGVRLAAERVLDLAAQVVHGQVAGVDHQVGDPVQVAQQRPLGGDAVDQPAAALQRVGPADALEPAHQHLVGGLQEQHPRDGTPAGRGPRSRSAGRRRRPGCARPPPPRSG